MREYNQQQMRPPASTPALTGVQSADTRPMTDYKTVGRVNILLHVIGCAILKCMGWRVEGTPPTTSKYVVIVAPHTSNWDFPMALFISWYYRMKGAWFGKHEIFNWPLLGWFFRLHGGIPVDRRRSHGLVEQAVRVFQEREHLVLALAPEGTRAKCACWKSGFYHIALKANVPIALGYLDFQRKCGGFGPLYYPTGDPETDLTHIRAFFDTVTPRHPVRRSEVVFRNNNRNKDIGAS